MRGLEYLAGDHDSKPGPDDFTAANVPGEPEVEERARYQGDGVEGEVSAVPLFREAETVFVDVRRGAR